MCMHWQGNAARALQTQIATWTEHQCLDEIKKEEDSATLKHQQAEEFATKNGCKLEDILRHGFYAGCIYFSRLKIQVLQARIDEIKGIKTDPEIPPPNSIIIMRN